MENISALDSTPKSQSFFGHAQEDLQLLQLVFPCDRCSGSPLCDRPQTHSAPNLPPPHRVSVQKRQAQWSNEYEPGSQGARQKTYAGASHTSNTCADLI